MKYVYILVGASEGFYFEQTLVSLASLKYICPAAKITLLIDDRTDDGGNPLLSQIREFVDEYIVRKFDENVPSIARSRMLKTAMRFLVEGDFLYVDSDTVWTSPINEADFTDDVMGVLDGHCLLNEHPLKNAILQDFEKTECNPLVEQYVNGGLLFVKDSVQARRFFEIWHEKWQETSKSGCFIDMPALNYGFKEIYGERIPLLHGSYNVQISRSWKYFPKSKMIHFFTGWMNEIGEKPYVFQRKSFWELVRKESLNDYVWNVLKNPLTAFDGPVLLYDDVDQNLKKTALYGLVRDMYERKIQGRKSSFDLLENLLRKLLH